MGALNRFNAPANLDQITAAIIALLNDARLRAGKPALGFLNPWIYSSGYKGFTDITGGQSDGCNGQNTQTGSAVNGVRNDSSTIAMLSKAQLTWIIVWCSSRCSLERYRRMGSRDWIWHAQLWCPQGRCVCLHQLERRLDQTSIVHFYGKTLEPLRL